MRITSVTQAPGDTRMRAAWGTSRMTTTAAGLTSATIVGAVVRGPAAVWSRSVRRFHRVVVHGALTATLPGSVMALGATDQGMSAPRLGLATVLCGSSLAVGLAVGGRWRQVLRDQRDWHRLAAEARLEAAGAAVEAADRLRRHVEHMIDRPTIAARAHALRRRRAARGRYA